MLETIFEENKYASEATRIRVELALDALLTQSCSENGLLSIDIPKLGAEFNAALDQLSFEHSEAYYQMVTENRQQPNFSNYNNPFVTSVVIYQQEEACH